MQREINVPAYLKAGKVVGYAMYIWVVFGIIVLGLRVFLLAFSANSSTPFVEFIYNTSDTFLQPFRGIFPLKEVGQTGYLDVAAMFAMIIYGLLGWGFSSLTSYFQDKIDSYREAALQMRQAKLQGAKQPRPRTTSR
ncbi:YggT family protein [Candidatus Saccharibacteria bacterium]|nr:YggT family protein [Candidatus Saccharibacteria bacterium]